MPSSLYCEMGLVLIDRLGRGGIESCTARDSPDTDFAGYPVYLYLLLSPNLDFRGRSNSVPFSPVLYLPNFAVCRALGDVEFKPYVSAIPDVTTVHLGDRQGLGLT